MANYIMQNSGFDLDAAVSAYKNGTIAKAKVGLGNVNNTSDLDKPVSTAVQTELDKKANAENADGGFIGGDGASASTGAAVGYGATTGAGFAGGTASFATSGAAVGYGAKASSGFAGGYRAKTVDSDGTSIDAIQLGEGTNSTPKTLQVYGYQLMDANGNIPAARLANAGGTLKILTGSYTGTGTCGADNPNTIEVGFKPKYVVISTSFLNLTDTPFYVSPFIYGLNNATYSALKTSKITSSTIQLAWSDTSISWYASEAVYQLNVSNIIYYYVIIGE